MVVLLFFSLRYWIPIFALASEAIVSYSYQRIVVNYYSMMEHTTFLRITERGSESRKLSSL
jgi:hypothetical protein